MAATGCEEPTIFELHLIINRACTTNVHLCLGIPIEYDNLLMSVDEIRGDKDSGTQNHSRSGAAGMIYCLNPLCKALIATSQAGI
jgi:hypothetical protein